jgi:hypothetical protein
MPRHWQDDLKGDPLPWLLEEENPSARYLTLGHLRDCDDCDSQATDAHEAISDWRPVREILALMNPPNFWGPADRPFYGGAVSTAATLNLLAELGLPPSAQIEAACENLLDHGQHASGGFSYDDSEERVMLCHTGNAIRTLLHFGYQGDPRLACAFDYLVERSAAPDGLTCLYADGEACQWGIVKALGAFAALPARGRSDYELTIGTLADAVLDLRFDFEGRHACWLDLGFPLDYQSDLTELCDVLARLDYGTDPRFQKLLDIVKGEQTAEGRWIKRYGTRVLQVEQKGKPSKWITIRALRAIKHAHRTVEKAEQARVHQSLFS